LVLLHQETPEGGSLQGHPEEVRQVGLYPLALASAAQDLCMEKSSRTDGARGLLSSCDDEWLQPATEVAPKIRTVC